MNHFKSSCIAFTLAVIFPLNSSAGPYTDDLSKCLIESTSPTDRIDLVKWIFMAGALHPVVKPVTSVSEQQLDDANKTVAGLFMRLLTDTCKSSTEKALKYEGVSTIETSFRILGQVAGQELFSNPDVTNGMAGLDKYLDVEKLKALAK